MAVTYVGVSATATPVGTTTTASTTAVTPSLPAGTAAGDRVFLYEASSNTTLAAPTGWTLLYRDVQVGVTGTAPGAGTGRRYISAYYRDYDGVWTMPTLSLTSATQNSHAAAALALRKGSGESWDTPTYSAPGHDTTSGTGWSATIPSFTTVAGALLMTHSGHTAGGGTASGQTLTQTGATFANLTERYDNGTTTGNDVRLVFGTADVTTGATATLTRTGTLSVAGTGGTCVVQQTASVAVPQGPEQTVYVYPTAVRSDSNAAMTNPANALADDGVYATAPATAAAMSPPTGVYGWDMPAIPALPSDATFVRCDMQIEMRYSVATAGLEAYPEIYTAAFGTRLANMVITQQPTTDTVFTGSTALTPAQLSVPLIWAQSFYAASGAATISIDFVRYAVVYTQPAATGQNLTRTLTDAAALTDSASWELAQVVDRTLTDAAAITDSASWALTQSIDRTLTDSAAITDSASTVLDAQRTLTDSAAIGDSASTQMAAQRSLSDSAAITDSATASLAVPRALTDAAAITDWASWALTNTDTSVRVVAGTSALLEGLTPSSRYRVRVRARNTLGESAWSGPVTFATTAAAATLPTGSATGSLVSTNSTTYTHESRLGINTNMWEDNQARRPNGSRTLTAALADFKPKIMRYPGGEKGDGTTFFQAANQGAAGGAGPNPRLNRIGSDAWPSNDTGYWTTPTAAGTWAAGRPPYALQTFLADCAATGAEPLIVIALDGIYLAPPAGAGIRPTKAEMITNAVEMVRWLNVTNSYGVKYFEIGNETWQVAYLGGLGSTFANGAQYGTDFADVAAAMKAVDPTIQVGMNGYTVDFNDGFMSTAAAAVDFVSVHPYDTTGMSYATYQTATLSAAQIGSARVSLDKLPAQHRDRIWITTTETSHFATSEADPNGQNNLGSAIITAHLLGLQLNDPRVRHVMFWNSRWILPTRLAYDVLAADNTLLPTGRALQMLGQLSGRMVSATPGASGTGLIAYASQVPADGRTSVLVINRTGTARSGTIGVAGAVSAVGRQLTGSGPTATTVTLANLPAITVTGGVTSSISCPANSLTVVDFGY